MVTVCPQLEEDSEEEASILQKLRKEEKQKIEEYRRIYVPSIPRYLCAMASDDGGILHLASCILQLSRSPHSGSSSVLIEPAKVLHHCHPPNRVSLGLQLL